MKKQTPPMPPAFRFIRWGFPKLEKIAPKMAAKLAIRLFVSPIRFKPPPGEMLEYSSATRFTLRYKNNRLQGYTWGRGPVVIVQHGWSGRATQFRKLITRLVETGFKVVAVDAPGHGSSDGKRTNMVEFAEVVNLVSELFTEVEAVIGHSLGGAASLLAIERGLRPNKLVSVAAPTVGEEIIQHFANQLNAKGPVMEWMDDYVQERFNRPFSWFSGVEIAKRLGYEPNTLLIHDRDDYDVPVKHLSALHRELPHAEILVTEGLGHRRVMKDEQVIQTIVRFLQTNALRKPVRPLVLEGEMN